MKILFIRFLTVALVLSFTISCTEKVPVITTLPIIGNATITDKGDTIYPIIPDFSFIDQNGNTVTNETFKDKIYVSDFFFTHCPTICPRVTKQMLRIHDAFSDNSAVVLISHTIDPKHDTIGRLREYAEKLGVQADKWHFVRGTRDSVYDIAEKYFTPRPMEDKTEGSGGFDHSGKLILIDKNRHVRAFCNGTDAEDVDKFIGSIKILLKE